MRLRSKTAKVIPKITKSRLSTTVKSKTPNTVKSKSTRPVKSKSTKPVKSKSTRPVKSKSTRTVKSKTASTVKSISTTGTSRGSDGTTESSEITKSKTPEALKSTATSELKEGKTARVFQLKISLCDTKPEIWRRIQIPADGVTFEDLHWAIKDSMGWFLFGCSHLFYAVNPATKENVILSKPQPQINLTSDHPTNEILISDYLIKVGDYIRNEFPLGEAWLHHIELEKILDITCGPNAIYPKCIDGARACPPDDVGGSMGYQRLLEILANPKHEEYDDQLDWLNYSGYTDFEPSTFSKSDIDFTIKYVLK